MIGDRLAAARKKKGLTQIELAAALGSRYNQQMISHVERGRSTLRVDGLINVARELNVSADYLLGLTDDPASAVDRVPADLDSEPGNVEFVRIRQDYELPDWTEGNVIKPKVRALFLPRHLLEQMGITSEFVRIFEITGQSMYPTLPDGSVFLVDYQRTSLKDNRIYLVGVEESLLVKRLRARGDGSFFWCTDYWLGRYLVSSGFSRDDWRTGNWTSDDWYQDNELRGALEKDTSDWKPVEHSAKFAVLGEVVGGGRLFTEEGW